MQPPSSGSVPSSRTGKIAAKKRDSVPLASEPTYNSRYITNASTYPAPGCKNAPGNLPTIRNPCLSHKRTARSFVLTTKLNCIARNPVSLARCKECPHIALATPRPVQAGAVT